MLRWLNTVFIACSAFKADHCHISAQLMLKDQEKQTASLIFFILCIAKKVILFSVKSLSVVNCVWEIFNKIEEKVELQEIQPNCMFFTFIMRTQLITMYIQLSKKTETECFLLFIIIFFNFQGNPPFLENQSIITF